MNASSIREWFVLDRFNQAQGPYTLSEVQILAAAKNYLVCNPRAKEWISSNRVPEIQNHKPVGRIYELRTTSKTERDRFESAMDQLLQLCKLFVSDGYLSPDEIRKLDNWFQENQEVTIEWPGNVIAQRVEEVLADGVITDQERTDLQGILLRAVGGKPSLDEAIKLATCLPVDLPAPELSFAGKKYCFTGEFVFGPRSKCEKAVVDRSGICVQRPTTDTDFVVIGTIANPRWAHEIYGRKIEAAVSLQRSGHPVKILAEEHWAAFLMSFPASVVSTKSFELCRSGARALV